MKIFSDFIVSHSGYSNVHIIKIWRLQQVRVAGKILTQD